MSAQQERRDLWMLARGHQPGAVPAMPSDGTGVAQQMDEREQQINEARLGTWEKHIRMNDQMRFEASRLTKPRRSLSSFFNSLSSRSLSQIAVTATINNIRTATPTAKVKPWTSKIILENYTL